MSIDLKNLEDGDLVTYNSSPDENAPFFKCGIAVTDVNKHDGGLVGHLIVASDVAGSAERILVLVHQSKVTGFTKWEEMKGQQQ